MTGWKRRSRAPSFSMYLRYSSSVVAPMVWISPRDSAGLSMFEASMAPSAAPAPISVCSSSRKSTTFSDCRISFITALSRSSNWPRYLVPATSAPRSSWSSRFWASTSGTSWPDDPLGQPLDDGGLADAGLADQDRVVLGPAGEDLDHPLDLGLAADDRVELALARELGEIAGEFVEHRGLGALLRAAGSTGRRAGPASPGAPRPAARRGTRGSWRRSTALPS